MAASNERIAFFSQNLINKIQQAINKITDTTKQQLLDINQTRNLHNRIDRNINQWKKDFTPQVHNFYAEHKFLVDSYKQDTDQLEYLFRDNFWT